MDVAVLGLNAAKKYMMTQFGLLRLEVRIMIVA